MENNCNKTTRNFKTFKEHDIIINFKDHVKRIDSRVF